MRRQLQREQIDRDSARAAEDIRLRAQEDIRKGADAKLTNARRDQAIAAERGAADERIQVINLADTLSTLRRRATAETDVLTFADDILRAQRDLATTTEQRRDIDKKLLENATKRETVGANLVLRRADEGDPSISKQDIDGAKQTLSTQPTRVATQKKQIDRANESPLDAYRRELHEATDDTNAAFQSIEVNALQRLEDQISSSIGKVLGLKGAFGDLFGSILADLAKIEIKKAIIGFLDAGAAGAGGGAGGLVSTALKLFGGRASGGNVVGGGNYLVGENGPEILSMPSSGKVYPNGQLPSIAGAGGGKAVLTQHISIDARNSVVPAEFAGAILGEANKQARVFAQQAGRAAVEATPARIQRYSKLGS